MSTPNNASSASTPNYSTNVNRSKTKKWVEAKPVDYGGDDWGDDEYDDDIYDPPPPTKPTGLRQKGQAMPQTASSVDTNKKSYGELPTLPGQNQPRSSTGPAPLRKNSFDQGDEKRAFSSSGSAMQTYVTTPITGSSAEQRTSAPPLQASTQQRSVTGFRKSSQSELLPVDVSVGKAKMQASEARPDSKSDFTPQTASGSTDSYSGDIKSRQDYSPTAMPAPLSAISSPQNSTDSTAQFPPRKSSLTQQIRPDLSDWQSQPAAAARPWSGTARSSSPGVGGRTSKSPPDSFGSKPRNEARVGSPGMQATRSPTSPSTQKPLPFVRPADIYKRMAEEKERERQSLDSSRPSMESLVSDPMPDRSSSVANPPSRGSANPEDYGPAQVQVGVENDALGLHSARGLMPILEPVPERKSEYGFDGFNAKNLPSHSREASDATQISASETDNAYAENRFSRSPELPDLSRMSGFGDDFFSPAGATFPDALGSDRTPAEQTLPSQTQPHDIGSADSQHSLRTEPSLGFRTAVNSAFENANSVPPTPSSRLGESLGRSDSESTGTTGISPIMSRAPSGTAAAEARNREAEAREANTPAIAEVNEPDSSRQSVVDEVPPVRGTPEEVRIPAEEGDSLTPPARPQAEREVSFRPTLPGGWNSYATSTSDRTVQPDSTEAHEPVNYDASPVHEIAEEDELDVTPTAASLPLPPTPNSEVTASASRDNMVTSSTEQPRAQTDTTLPEPSQRDIVSGDDDDDILPPTPLKVKTNTTLSTESKPSDDENDRLRKEIVKSLSPRNSNVGPDSILPNTVGGPNNTERDIRESYYLPSEYDNYWNDQEDEAPIGQDSASSSPSKITHEIPPIPPLAARKIDKSPEIKPVTKRRFSWEEEGEQLVANQTSPSGNHVHSPIVEPPTPTAPSVVAKDGTMDVKASAPTGASSEEAQINLKPNGSNDEDTTSGSGSEAYIGEAVLATGGLATAATYGSRDATRGEEDKPDPDISTHEDEPAHPLSSSPVYPLEHPSTDAVPHSTASLDRVSPIDRDDSPPTISHTQRLSLSQGIGKGHHTTNTTLKELLEIPNPYDRIRAYGDVQNKIMAADTGLDAWLMALKSENPDLADIDGNYGGSTPFVASSTRSKFSRALNPNSNNLQQPYYQQYLNASSPTSPQPTANSSANVPSSSQQGGLSGFSGGGSKITTQQVQAKSKEFLHTAGVFGGKGMKAGKGLLAKGKSRFASRGAGGVGGADKIHDANFAMARPASDSRPVSSQRSFGHRRFNTVDAVPSPSAKLGREAEDSTAVGEPEIKGLSKRSTFGFGSGDRSSKFGSLPGRLSKFGKPGMMGMMGNRKLKELEEVDKVGFSNDLRGVHEMHFKKSDSPAPVLPAITVDSNLEGPTRAMSMDSSAWAAREEYHWHKRSESGLSFHSRSGSAMSGTRRDMSFFLADDNVSEDSRDGSVSYGESDENVSYGVAKPAPISKFQPTWDPYMASPILEGEEESPLSRHGTTVAKLVQTNPPPVPLDGSSNTAPPTIPVASSSETPVESPIIGHHEVGEVDDEPEPEDWVVVEDTHIEDAAPKPQEFAPAIAPLIQPDMASTEREIAPSRHPIQSSIQSQGEERPTISMPISRLAGAGTMTAEEAESPIIPMIFRTIKGDPSSQYTRALRPEKPEGQDSPKFSLPPIRRGSTFGSLVNGWTGVLSRSGSRASRISRASRRFPIDDDSDDEPEEMPPMATTTSYARPSTSESAKRAKEKMKAVSVAESDEISQPEENHTIGALVAAGLVAAAFGDEKPSPVGQRHSTQTTYPATDNKLPEADLEKRMSRVDGENQEPISQLTSSPDTQFTDKPKEAIETPGSESTVRLPVVVHEEASEVPDRPSTPVKDVVNPAILQITPEAWLQLSEQSTPATLVEESRVPDRLSKSSEQWVESAPMVDSYIPPSHPPPNHPPPSPPVSRPGNFSMKSRETPEASEQKRSQRPDVRIDTTQNSSPSLSTRVNVNSSPLQHRSLPPYESPRVYIPPSIVRQTYHGVGSFQAPPPSFAQKNQDLSPRDLPEHLYQAPITREETFLPRQQVSEYQIPGVGPPPDEAPSSATRSSRRSSAFFKEIGGRFSRSGSLVPEDSTVPSSPSISRNNEMVAPSVSSVTSEDIREKIRRNSRRSSLFGLGSGSLSRSSTNNANSVGSATPGIGNDYGEGNNGNFHTVKPSLRESMITHRPDSWRDTTEEDATSPISPLDPGVGRAEKERRGPRAFFGNVSGRPRANSRSFIPGDNIPTKPTLATKEKGIKRTRFSGLNFGGFLGRGSAGKNKDSISEENHPPPTPNSTNSIQRTPIEYRPRNKSLGQLPILVRPFQGRGNRNPRTDENHDRADSEERAMRRRASAHALLMGPLPPAYSPSTNDFGNEPLEEIYRDPEKEDISMHVHPAHRPAPRQTPIFVEEIPDRGRRKNKEPQYDTPPIPGAYDLVRGDGNSTRPYNYDPYGHNSNLGVGGSLVPQNDPAFYKRAPASNRNSQSPSRPPPLHPSQRSQTQLLGATYGPHSSSRIPIQADASSREDFQSFGSPPRQFDGTEEPPWADSMSGALEGAMGLKKGLVFGEDGRITWQQARTRRNPSREDLLARSPARPPHGQQRPYQLSLPEEEENSYHGKQDYSNNRSMKSGFPNASNRGSNQGLGLGLGFENGSQQRRENSAGTARHMDLHPDLKRPESGQNYPLAGNGIFPTVRKGTTRDIETPPLRGQTSNAQWMLSPNSGRDYDLARSNSEVSQTSRNVVSPPPPATKSSPRSVDDVNTYGNNSANSFYNNTKNQSTESKLEHIRRNAQRRSPPVPIQVAGIDITDTDTDIYDASPIGAKMVEPEEKIVDEHNQGRSDVAELAAGNDEDEDKVVMSATSYPGMEWNPYMYGDMVDDYTS